MFEAAGISKHRESFDLLFWYTRLKNSEKYSKLVAGQILNSRDTYFGKRSDTSRAALTFTSVQLDNQATDEEPTVLLYYIFECSETQSA